MKVGCTRPLSQRIAFDVQKVEESSIKEKSCDKHQDP